MINFVYWLFTAFPVQAVNKILELAGNEKSQFSLEHWVFKHKIRWERGVLGKIRWYMLRYQISYHMWMIRTQDKALYKYPHQLDNMPSDHLAMMARERGIDLNDREDIIVVLRKYWLPYSVNDNNLDDLLVWVSLSRFSFNDVIN